MKEIIIHTCSPKGYKKILLAYTKYIAPYFPKYTLFCMKDIFFAECTLIEFINIHKILILPNYFVIITNDHQYVLLPTMPESRFTIHTKETFIRFLAKINSHN